MPEALSLESVFHEEVPTSYCSATVSADRPLRRAGLPRQDKGTVAMNRPGFP